MRRSAQEPTQCRDRCSCRSGLCIAIATALVAGMLVTPAAAASPPLKPPVIHEKFTPLPCPKTPKTTVDLEGCAEKAILTTDRAINAKVKTIFGLLRARAARQSFVTSELAWLLKATLSQH